MTVNLELKPEVEKAIRKHAEEHGFAVADYVGRIVERDIERQQNLDSLLAPIRKNFADSGRTDEELNELANRARRRIRQEKRGKQG